MTPPHAGEAAVTQKTLREELEALIALEKKLPLAPRLGVEFTHNLARFFAARSDELRRALELADGMDYRAAAIYFAEQLFALLSYRRAHSLSREIWHEAEEWDVEGMRCIAFLDEHKLLERHPEHDAWYRHVDPAKRANPPEITIEKALENMARKERSDE